MKLFSKKQDDIFFLVDEVEDEIDTAKTLPEPAHALTVDEVLSTKIDTSKRFDSTGALNSLKKRMLKTVEQEERSLLEKCKPYIVDDKGDDASIETEPAYKLESVEEILKSEDQKVIDQLAHKYDISYDYLGKYIEQKATNKTETASIHQKVEEEPAVNEKQPKKEEFEDKIIINHSVKNIQSSVPVIISDIDDKSFIPEKQERDISSTATITFTPVTAEDSSQSKIVVTTKTQQLDLTGELEHIEDTSTSYEDNRTLLENDEFDDYIPKNEITTEKDGKKFARTLALKKRKSFLLSVFSVLFTLLLAGMKLPFMSDLILGETFGSMIAATIMTFVVILLNASMFISLPKIFTSKSTPDVLACLSSIFVIAYAVVGIIKGEIILDLLLTLCIILCLRQIGIFKKHSYMLSNLKQILNQREKNAVNLINDPAVTFAMAKDFIEGDVLIAAPQKCSQIADYVKYSTFGESLNGKLPTITVLALLFSIISGFATASYFDGMVYGFYAAAAIQCFASLPSLFFIENLPLYSAAAKLNKSGNMIAGNAGAKKIEMANGLVLNSTDLFPIGTVTLHQMQVLSDNNLDETILRAASLTQTLNSPLAPIFKRIAGESNITNLPDSDTVKYEDKMGISGWVDDKLLFIGNRTLMEAHGIKVPSIDVDRKILRGGYFPVYVASGNKACALLMVHYDVSPTVARELRRLTKLGVTLLISNTDPNITKEMICDYLGLYDDSVMLMTTAGCHMYKNSIKKEKICSAPAAFRGSAISLAKIMNAANKIQKSNSLLTILYIIASILGIIIFAYSSFNGAGTLIESGTILLYTLISTAISYILYLTQKP